MSLADLTRFLAWLRRYPFSVTCTIVALVLGVSSWFLWQKDQALKDDLAKHAQDGENMLATVVSGKTMRADLDYVRKFTRRIESNLVAGDNLADNKGYFYRIEKQAHVSLNDIQQFSASSAEAESLYRRIPFVLHLTGGAEQLAFFLRSVETGPRLAVINSFTFRRNGSQLMLDLSVELLGKP
jgi:Tfp pilus assembly protein PilO